MKNGVLTELLKTLAKKMKLLANKKSLAIAERKKVICYECSLFSLFILFRYKFVYFKGQFPTFLIVILLKTT